MSSSTRTTDMSGDDRIMVIAELTRSLVTTTNLNELLLHIVTAIGKVLHFDDCILYLWSHSRQKLVQRAAFGPKLNTRDSQIKDPIELSLGEGVVGSVARSQLSEIIPDVRMDSRYVSDIDGTLSEITVPIVYRGTLIGVIDAESFELDAFNHDDLTILSTFADLCASALTNLRHLRRERRQAHRVLESTEARYRDVVELSSDMIYTTTPVGIIEYVNPACRDLLDLEAIDIIGRPIVDFVSDSMRDSFKERLEELRRGDVQRIAVEVPMVGAKQSHVLTEQTISATRAEDGGRDRLIGYQAIVRDITRHEALQKSLTYLANHDPLTDLLSRRGFESELDAEFRRLSKTRGECVLFWIDVDDFKKINDTYGHTVGDNVLKMIASIFKELTRHEDAVARFGGDEFMILLRECDIDAAEATARRMTQSIHTRVGPEFDMPRPITVSIGMAGKRLSDQYPEDLMARADEALYSAKLEGRNCYRVHRDELGTMDGAEAFNEDREELEQGLAEGRFELYAQPILNLTSGRVTQYELLLRYNDRSGRVILPADVLAVAERSTLIRQIDRWVVQRTIEILESDALPAGAGVEANLSGRAFSDPSFLDLIKEKVSKLGEQASRLTIEITETSAVSDLADARRFISELEALGCNFAIDDFGVGYSSFHYLKHLPASYLKIDGSFITDLPTSATDQHLVRCIVDVARGLGKKTVAEFVDKRESLLLLRNLGVDFAQGYYIGHPRPISEIKADYSEQEMPIKDVDWTAERPATGTWIVKT